MKLFAISCPNCKGRLSLFPHQQDWWRTIRSCPTCGVGLQIISAWYSLLYVIPLLLLVGIETFWLKPPPWQSLLNLGVIGAGIVVGVVPLLSRWGLRAYPSAVARCPHVKKWDRTMFLGGLACNFLAFLIFEGLMLMLAIGPAPVAEQLTAEDLEPTFNTVHVLLGAMWVVIALGVAVMLLTGLALVMRERAINTATEASKLPAQVDQSTD
jgi:hypothetical protein